MLMKLYNHVSFEAENQTHTSLEGPGSRHCLDNDQPCKCLNRRRTFEEVIEYGANGQAIPQLLNNVQEEITGFTHKPVRVESPE